MRAHQHLSAGIAQMIAQQRRVDDFDLVDAQLAVPDVELVQQGVGKGHELPEHPPAGRAQLGTCAPVGQALLILPGGLASAAAENEEVQDDAVQHWGQQTPTEHLGGERGEFHQPETAALLAVGPMLLVFLNAHARHRRQRIRGKRTSMPKNNRVCMLEISALSWNRRKCETPS
ncbi:hypothetical protein D3C78_1177740 [compost metagenome]